jgi:Tfp pilus assembly protein PilF
VGRYESGDLEKAEYNLQRAFDYPELGYNAHYYLSLIYKKQEKRDLERTELEKYISLSSNVSAIAKAKARIKVLSQEAQSPVLSFFVFSLLNPIFRCPCVC